MDADHSEQWDEDPGWRVGWHSLTLFVPYLWMRDLRRRDGDPLVNLRSVYLSFPLSLIGFCVVLLFVLPFRGDQATLPWALAIAGIAAIESVLPRIIERPMPCDSLAGYFRTRMFLRIACANTTALVGFVFAFATNSSWLYYFGLLLSIPGLVRAAPTKAALVRDQDELTARGCNKSLVAALRTTPPKPK